MKLTECSMEDGRKCAQLLNLLKNGKWELSGTDIRHYSDTVQWVHSLALQMAEQLQTTCTTNPISSKSEVPIVNNPKEGFRIKAMGPIGASGTQKKQRKSK